MELDPIDAIDISLDAALYEREEEDSSLQKTVQSAANRALDLLYSLYLIPAHCFTAYWEGGDAAMVKVLESGNKTSLVFFSVFTMLALSPSIEDAICAEMPKTLDWLLKKEPIDLNKLFFSSEIDEIEGESEFASPMCLAVCTGNIELLEVLARHGASVSIPDPKRGFTPLHIATKMKNGELAKWLIDQDANLFAQTFEDGGTPLFLAVAVKSLPLIRCLVEAGSPLHLPAHNGLAPLHLAICLEDEECIRYLLEKGAYIDQPIEGRLRDRTDLESMSPLHLAIGTNSLKTVKILTENHASLSSSFHGFTPLEFAKLLQQNDLREDYQPIIAHLQSEEAKELPEPF